MKVNVKFMGQICTDILHIFNILIFLNVGYPTLIFDGVNYAFYNFIIVFFLYKDAFTFETGWNELWK